MTRNSLKSFLIFHFLFIGILAAEGGDKQSKLRRDVEKSGEKFVTASIQLSTGLIYINKAAASKVFSGEFLFTERPPMVDYEVVGDEGQLRVKFTDKKNHKKHYAEENSEYNVDIDEVYDRECYLSFSDQIPLALEMDLGVIKGEMDLGGLQLSDCKISTAVSKATMNFKDRNLRKLDNLNIENGVGKLQMYNLGNANFTEFVFEAGVGSYELDFSGDFSDDAEATIEIGMGKLEIFLPRNIGVRIKIDQSFLSSLDIDEVYKDGDYYYNDKWDSSAPKLDLNIDSGVAAVDIVWVDY